MGGGLGRCIPVDVGLSWKGSAVAPGQRVARLSAPKTEVLPALLRRGGAAVVQGERDVCGLAVGPPWASSPVFSPPPSWEPSSSVPVLGSLAPLSFPNLFSEKKGPPSTAPSLCGGLCSFPRDQLTAAAPRTLLKDCGSDACLLHLCRGQVLARAQLSQWAVGGKAPSVRPSVRSFVHSFIHPFPKCPWTRSVF